MNPHYNPVKIHQVDIFNKLMIKVLTRHNHPSVRPLVLFKKDTPTGASLHHGNQIILEDKLSTSVSSDDVISHSNEISLDGNHMELDRNRQDDVS